MKKFLKMTYNITQNIISGDTSFVVGDTVVINIDIVESVTTSFVQPYDLTGQTVAFTFLKEDGNYVIQTDRITLNKDKITIELDTQATILQGSIKMQMKITDLQGSVSTSVGYLHATANIKDLGQESLTKDSEFNTIKNDVAILNDKLTYITPEQFGAKGDGTTDDTDAIKLMHETANLNNVSCMYSSNKTYFLKFPKNIPVKTNTDFNNCKIIIDLSNMTTVDCWYTLKYSSRQELTLTDALKTQIKNSWKKGNNVFDCFSSYPNSFIRVLDTTDIICKRDITPPKTYTKEDTIFIDKKLSSPSKIKYEFNNITNVYIKSGEDVYLNFKNLNIETKNEYSLTDNNYAYPIIKVERCKSILENINFYNNSVNKTIIGGIIGQIEAFDVTYKNINLQALKSDVNNSLISSYALMIQHSEKTFLTNVNATGNNESWGALSGNYIKDTILEKCTLNRIDVHCDAFNYTIRDCNSIGYGINISGGGTLLIENTNVLLNSQSDHISKNCFLFLRGDYGSRWDGDIVINNSSFTPNPAIESALINWKPNPLNDYGKDMNLGYNISINNVTIDKLNSDLVNKCTVINPRFIDGTPINNFYLPNGIDIRNVKVVNGKPCVVPFDIFAQNPYNYLGIKSTVNTGKAIDTNCDIYVYNCDTINEQMVGINDLNFMVDFISATVEPNNVKSFIPNVLIEKCSGLVSLGKYKGKFKFKNCEIGYVNITKDGVANDTEITFEDCRIIPKLKYDNTFYIRGITQSTISPIKFNNCEFYFPIINGAKTNAIANYSIWYKNVIRGYLNNCSFAKEILDADILNNLNTNNLSKNDFIKYATNSDGIGLYQSEKAISLAFSIEPDRGFWDIGSYIPNANQSDNFYGFRCVKSGYTAPVWFSGTKGVGTICVGTTNNKVFVCTVGGTTGSTEPIWNTALNGLTTDGTVTWKCIEDKCIFRKELK